MSRPKIAVSACLLGERCRYDGASKADAAAIAALEGCEIVPFCPEAPVLGTPRERISVVQTPVGARVIADESRRDVTEALEAQTAALLQGHPDLHGAVLKSKSPSCGIGTTPLLNAHGETLGVTSGAAARMLIERLGARSVIDEHQVIKEKPC